MDLIQLIQHPEKMNRETLYELRSLVALHPYFQTARLLMLKNLYLLHDPDFDAELKKAALFLGDRKALFNLVEAAHYRLAAEHGDKQSNTAATQLPHEAEGDATERGQLTATLIDDFLSSVPEETTDDEEKTKKPRPVDAAIDYVAYLAGTEKGGEEASDSESSMRGQSLIDNFIMHEGGKIQLKEDVTPQSTANDNNVRSEDNNAGSEAETSDIDGVFTETLAKIYIKQGKFDKALEIIQRLNLIYPKKNVYFADQIRFLEKLILNNKQIN